MKLVAIALAIICAIFGWFIKTNFIDEEVIQFDEYSLDLEYNRIFTHINITNAIKSCNIVDLNDIKSKASYLNYIKKNCTLPFIQYSSNNGNNNYIYHQINSNQYVFHAEYNASLNYLPSIIFLPLNKLHLQLIVLFANTFNYIIAIRSGGHQYNGFNTCHIKYNNNNKCILIDMSNFNNIILDMSDNSLILESGLRGKEVYNYLLKYNMFLPIGTCAYVGIGGNLQTSGGNIWLFKKFGPATDYITSFEILLANNTFLNISKTTNEHLFRNFFLPKGAPGSFGIITKYKLNTTLFHDKYYKNSYRVSIIWKFNVKVLKKLLYTVFEILASNLDESKAYNTIAPHIAFNVEGSLGVIQFAFIYIPENENDTIYNTNLYSKYRVNDIFNIYPEYQINFLHVSAKTKWFIQKFASSFNRKFRRSFHVTEIPFVYGNGDLSKLNYYSAIEGYPSVPPYKLVGYQNNMVNSILFPEYKSENLILNVTKRQSWINAVVNETEYILNQNEDNQFGLWGHWTIFNMPLTYSLLSKDWIILQHDYFVKYIANEINYNKALSYISLIEKVYEKHWYKNPRLLCCSPFNNISDEISIHKYWNEFYTKDIYQDLIKLKTELDPKNIFNNRL
eukprot:462239_1